GERERKPSIAVIRRHDVLALDVFEVVDVLEGLDHVAQPSVAFRIECFDSDNARSPGHANGSLVEWRRTYLTRHGRSLVQVVLRVAIIVDEVISMDVIDVAVAVVVDAVARDFERVRPDIRRQVRVGVVHTSVDHGDENVGRTGRDLPRLGSVDVYPPRAYL